jgi:hypothetical protein
MPLMQYYTVEIHVIFYPMNKLCGTYSISAKTISSRKLAKNLSGPGSGSGDF